MGEIAGSAVLSVGSAGVVARGELAGLNLREPDAVGCAGGPAFVTEVRGIGSVGEPGGAVDFCSLTLESNGIVAGAESSTRIGGRVGIVDG
jgi:hypothetical protein